MVPEGTGPVAEEVTESGLLRFLDGLGAERGGISKPQPKCTLTNHDGEASSSRN